jgi:uncharacterized RDD family membrane protein YckC
MSMIDEYVEAVLAELPPEWPWRGKVEADLREHLDASVEAGASEEEAIARMGDPADVAAGFLSTASPVYASAWRRVGAFAIDLGLGLNLFAVIPLIIMLLNARGPDFSPIPAAATMLLVGVVTAGALMAIVYFPLMEAHYGRTIGKKAFGMMVVRENGSRIGWKEALIRRIPLFFQFIWIDGFFILFSPKKQRAFDIVAGTIVVRTDTNEGPPRHGIKMLVLIIAFPIVAVLSSVLLDYLVHTAFKVDGI